MQGVSLRCRLRLDEPELTAAREQSAEQTLLGEVLLDDAPGGGVDPDVGDGRAPSLELGVEVTEGPGREEVLADVGSARAARPRPWSGRGRACKRPAHRAGRPRTGGSGQGCGARPQSSCAGRGGCLLRHARKRPCAPSVYRSSPDDRTRRRFSTLGPKTETRKFREF